MEDLNHWIISGSAAKAGGIVALAAVAGNVPDTARLPENDRMELDGAAHKA